MPPPTLPRELLSEIGVSAQDSSLNNRKPGASKGYKTNISMRKQLRKQKRTEKKQRHAQFYNRKRSLNSSEDMESEEEVEPKRYEKAAGTKHDRKRPAIVKEVNPARNMERFAASNPELYQRLKEDRLINDEIQESAGDGRFHDEEKAILRYAKKLGMKDADAVTDVFKKDGLDFLLDFDVMKTSKKKMTDEDGKSKAGASETEEEEAAGDVFSEDQLSDDSCSSLREEECCEIEDVNFESEDLSSESDGLSDEAGTDVDKASEAGMSDGELTADDFKMAESESCSDQISNVDDASEQSDSDSDAVTDGSQDMTVVSDFGKSRTSADNTASTLTAVGKYIPPHLRKMMSETKSEAYMRLQRQTQGLLNRLSEANLEPIFSSLEDIFRSNPRHDVTEILTQLVLDAIADQANLLESFVAVYAALLSLVYNVIGTDVGASFVQCMIEMFDRTYQESRHAKESAESDKDEVLPSSKKCHNLSVLIAYLYNFRITSSLLVMDLVNEWTNSLNEFEVELLLKVVRISGQHLRGDNPMALKTIIQQLQGHASTTGKTSVRFQFMLEQVLLLKNNRMAKRSMNNSAQQASTVMDQLKKFVQNYVRKRQLPSHEPLGCSLDDIRSVDAKGKWWVVGAAWVGRQADDANLPARHSQEEDSKSSALLQLAKKLNVNTEIRRRIFVVIMSSEDYADAFERLMKLNLKDKQEREVVRMLVYCCGLEKAYNPFYAVLGERLCRFSHNHKITFQFTLWDMLKELNAEDKPLRQILNHADMYAFLIQQHALSLGVLKAVDFATLVEPGVSEPTPLVIFLQRLLLQCLLGPSQEEVAKVFDRIAGVTDLSVFRKGLLLMMTQWIRKRLRPQDDAEPSEVSSLAKCILGSRQSAEEIHELIKRRFQLAKETLQSNIKGQLGR